MNYNLRDIFGTGNISNVTMDDILDKIGLQKVPPTGSYVLPAVGLFGIGVVVGASLGMLFAPKTGHDLRENLGHKAKELAGKVGIGGRGGEFGGGEDFGRGYERGSTYQGAGVGSVGTAGIGGGGVIGSSYEGKGTYGPGGEGGA